MHPLTVQRIASRLASEQRRLSLVWNLYLPTHPRGYPKSFSLAAEFRVSGLVLDIDYSPPSFLRRDKRGFREPRVPIAKRSVSHRTVIVVFARQRAAKATFTASPLGRV